MQARRGLGERDLAAARAHQPRQQELRHLPDNPHVSGLAHRGSAAGAAPSRGARQDRHSVGGAAASVLPGSGSRCGPLPLWPGCPPRLRSLLRSRSDSCRCLALRASLAAIGSFDDGVPESELSMFRRRSSSAIRSSIRRMRSSAASRLAVSDAICSSFATMTARSRAASG